MIAGLALIAEVAFCEAAFCHHQIYLGKDLIEVVATLCIVVNLE